MRNNNSELNKNLWSSTIKAGKKTYFVDLKMNEKGLCLMVKESRKVFEESGAMTYRKSTIVVYPEDITRFMKAIENGFQEMKQQLPDFDFKKYELRDAQWKAENQNQATDATKVASE